MYRCRDINTSRFSYSNIAPLIWGSKLIMWLTSSASRLGAASSCCPRCSGPEQKLRCCRCYILLLNASDCGNKISFRRGHSWQGPWVDLQLQLFRQLRWYNRKRRSDVNHCSNYLIFAMYVWCQWPTMSCRFEVANLMAPLFYVLLVEVIHMLLDFLCRRLQKTNINRQGWTTAIKI